MNHLIKDLKRIKNCRDTDRFFKNCNKSYRAASKDTKSWWCKSIVKESGITIHECMSHSYRDAASSYAKCQNISLVKITQTVG